MKRCCTILLSIFLACVVLSKVSVASVEEDISGAAITAAKTFAFEHFGLDIEANNPECELLYLTVADAREYADSRVLDRYYQFDTHEINNLFVWCIVMRHWPTESPITIRVLLLDARNNEIIYWYAHDWEHGIYYLNTTPKMNKITKEQAELVAYEYVRDNIIDSVDLNCINPEAFSGLCPSCFEKSVWGISFEYDDSVFFSRIWVGIDNDAHIHSLSVRKWRKADNVLVTSIEEDYLLSGL